MRTTSVSHALTRMVCDPKADDAMRDKAARGKRIDRLIGVIAVTGTLAILWYAYQKLGWIWIF